MNERIRELAEQSGAWEYYEINEGVDGDEKPLEKFAELIVRECAGISIQHNKTYYTSHGKRIAKKIKEYFGVEE